MPYTEDEKKNILLNLGIDPEKYSLDEENKRAIPKQFSQPESNSRNPDNDALSPPISQGEQYSTTGTIARHAAANVIPTGLGLAGGVGLGALGGSWAGPPGMLVGGLVGGVGTAYAAKKLQDQFLTQKFKQELEESAQQNPKSAFVGELAPSLAAFNPIKGISELPTLAGALRKAPQVLSSGMKALSPVEQNVLQNALINASVSGGQNIAQQNSSEQPFSVGSLAASVLPSLIMNEPTKLGSKIFGFHPTSSLRDIEVARQNQLAQNRSTQAIPDESLSPPMSGRYDPNVGQGDVANYDVTKSMAQRDAETAFQDQSQTRQKEFELAKEEERNQQLKQAIELRKQNDELKDQLSSEKPLAENSLRIIEPSLKENVGALKSTEENQPTESAPYEYTTKQDRIAKENETKPLSEAELIQEHADKFPEQYSTPGERPALLSDLTPEQRQHLIEHQTELASKRGYQTEIKPRLTNTETGQEVAGVNKNDIGRNIQVSEVKGGPGTIPHEAGGHGFLNDLSRSNDPKDVKLHDRIVNGIFKGDEEEAAKAFENAAFHRDVKDLYGTKKQKFMSWLGDVKAHFKYKLGAANDQDVIQHLNARYNSDSPFYTRFELPIESNQTKPQQFAHVFYHPDEIDKMSAKDFYEAAHNMKGGMTQEAIRVGLQNPDLEMLQKHRDNAEKQYKQAIAEKKFEDAGIFATKAQYFREAMEAAKGEGGIGEMLKAKGIGKEQYSGWSNLKPEDLEYLKEFTGLKAEDLKRILEKEGKTAEGTKAQRELTMVKVMHEKGFIKKEEGSHNLALDEAQKQALDEIEKKAPSEGKEQEQYSHDPGITLPAFRAEINKIPNEKVREASTEFYRLNSRNQGKYVTVPRQQISDALGVGLKSGVKSYIEQSNEAADKLLQYKYDIKDNGNSNINLSPEQQRANKAIVDYFKEVGQQRNARSGLHQGQLKPDTYIPLMPSRQVQNILTNKRDTPEGQKLIDDFITYAVGKGKTVPEAEKELKDWLNAYASRNIDIAKGFGPLDKAEGIGIPPSWRETNLLDLMSRYGERVARRLAYYDSIESKPDVQDALYNTRTGVAAQENTQNVMRNIAGARPFYERNLEALSGVVRANIFGPLTGLKDIATSQFLGWQHQSFPQALKSGLKSLDNMSQNFKETMELGLNRKNIGSLEFGDDIARTLRRVRDITTEVTGRNILEKVSRTLSYGQGKFLALDNFQASKNGSISKQGEKFLNDFGPTGWKTKQALTPEELKETAAKYVESVQQTYDYRDLPHAAVEGSMAPVLALARWNIGKTNNFMKHVITPAIREGNFTPLLMATIGTALGGELATKISELITNRKERTPSYAEIAATEEGKTKAILYKAAGLASLGGYAGMLGDLTKSAFDIGFKNKPQSLNNVLVSLGANVTENAANLVEALQDGKIDLGLDFISKILEDNVQSYRIILNHPDLFSGIAPEASKERQEKLDKQEKLRDFKMFRNLYDYPVSDIDKSVPNIFKDKKEKQFKSTSDVNKAVALAPELIEQAIKDSGGDYEKLVSKLRALKENSYQTMPSMEKEPIEFSKYLAFVRQSQGDSKALSLLSGYVQQNSLNKIKSSLIP